MDKEIKYDGRVVLSAEGLVALEIIKNAYNKIMDKEKMDKKEEPIADWNEIRKYLISCFNICPCQRKLKSIVDNLFSIYKKCEEKDWNFTGAEWLLIAIIDSGSNAIIHGINCEYPIVNKDHFLWKWVIETKDNPNLKDN